MAEAKTTKAEAKEELITIIIPKNQLNPNDKHVNVCINGKVTQVMRGVEVKVTSQIKEVLKKAGYLS